MFKIVVEKELLHRGRRSFLEQHPLKDNLVQRFVRALVRALAPML